MPEAELDARVLPKPEKHKTIFATFDQLGAGEAFILINDHEPEPLRKEFEAEHPGSYGWEYLQRGKEFGEIWRTRISKLASTAVPWVLTNTETVGADVEADPAGVVWKLEMKNRELDAEVTALADGQDTGMHTGPELDSLVHVLSGGGSLTTELSTVELRPGDLLWMPRRSKRQFVAGPGGLRYLTVHQKRQFLNLMSAGLG